MEAVIALTRLATPVRAWRLCLCSPCLLCCLRPGLRGVTEFALGGYRLQVQKLSPPQGRGQVQVGRTRGPWLTVRHGGMVASMTSGLHICVT